MTIGEITQTTASAAKPAREGPASRDVETAARNREVAEAVRAINEADGVGPSQELRFSVDRDSGRPLIRIVDRITDEVITQFPSEAALRAAEVLRSLRPGERIA